MPDAAQRRPEPMSVEAFLALCDAVPDGERWELHDGQPVMMIGGTAAHAITAGNLLRALFEPARRRGCRPLGGFFIRANDASLLEPDVTVLCGTIDPRSRFSDHPVLVVEVLSPSTMRYDRGAKLDLYGGVPGLRQIVLVYQDSVRVESWSRDEGTWAEEAAVLLTLEDSLAVPVLGASLALADIYAGVRAP